jgi:hypothetical protein
MLRAIILFALVFAAAVFSRSASAALDSGPAAPAAIAPAIVTPAAVAPPGPEIALGALQLVVGYGVEVGGIAVLAAIGLAPKNLGFHSDYANVGFVVALAPALAGVAICGTGTLSRSYRGRCTTTLLGAYAGAALGTLLGLAFAPSPGPDDTAAFTNTIGALIGVGLLAPIGAMIGYHAGKRELARDGAAVAAAPGDDVQMAVPPVVEPRRGALTEPPARRVLLSVVNLSW